jgi:hypothetical protein
MTCGDSRISVATITGAWSVTLATGNTLGDCDETIPLQQS